MRSTSTTAEEVYGEINVREIVSILMRVAQNSENDSARVAAATRLLDHWREYKAKSEGTKIYEELLGFKDEK